MHLHGMGVGVKADHEKSVEILANASGYEIIPLHYGDIFEAAGLMAFADAAADEDAVGLKDLSKEEAYRLGRDEAFLEGYAAAALGFQNDGAGIEEQGQLGQDAAQAVRALWRYVAKYVARDNLHSDVLAKVKKTILTQAHKRGLKDKSVVLIGHSLGSIVALDILADPDLSPLFCRLVTVGSPAGMIAAVPWVHRDLLPVQRRAVGIEWIDIYDETDLLTKYGLTDERKFKGNPLRFRNTKQPHGFPTSHTAYFTDEAVVAGWAALLDGGPT